MKIFVSFLSPTDMHTFYSSLQYTVILKLHPLRLYNFAIQINFPGLFLFACVPNVFKSSVSSAKQL